MARKQGKSSGRVWQEVGKRTTDRLSKAQNFEVPSVFSGPPRNAFIFRWPGDRIEGRLIAGPICNNRRNSSYKIETADGDEVEFFGNKQIHETIRKGELLGSWIRIEYIGQQVIPGCKKARKVYRIWKDKGVVTPKYSEVTT